MAYTQEQINAALAAELAARPQTSQAALNAYAKATYGLTDAQLNAAYDTIPGFNAQGKYDAADYIATSQPGQVSPQMVVDAANAANPYSAQNMARVDTTRQGQYVQDASGRPVALTAYSPGFDINNPTALQSLGELRAMGGSDSVSQAFNAIATPAQKAEADRLWSIEKARLEAIDKQAGLLTTAGQTTQTGQAGQAQAVRTYTPAETAAYNAFKSGDIAAANNAIQSGKLTAAQMKSSFGFTDADIAYLANSSGIKFYTPPTAVTTGVTTGVTGGTTVGNKTYTQAETDLYNAFKSANIAEFNRIAAANKFTSGDMQSKFGLTDADMAYLASNAGVKFYSPTDTTVTNTGGLGGLGGYGSTGQNFQNYQSIPIGAQYNPNVTVGGASPYSQIMGQMRPFSNPYAGLPVNQPMGGYDPGLYDRILAANTAKAAAATTVGNTTDVNAGGGDSGDGGDGGGGDGGGNGSGAASGDCVDPDVHILLADRSTVRAGDLKVGDMLHTLHDETFIYGDFPVEYVNILQRPKVEAQFDDGQKIIISITHKFLTSDNKWEKISDIEIGTSIRGFGDVTKKLVSITDVGTGPVIEMVVTDAHTYISEGLVSHNKFYGGLITNVSGSDPAGPDEGQVNMKRGEYVIKKSSADKYGRGLLDMINEGKVPAKKLKSLLG